MPRFVPLILSMCFALFARGQNLVVNGGFEEIDTCEISDGDISKAIGWYDLYDRPTFGPDVFNICASDDNYNTVNNTGGPQLPLEGVGYGGFLIWLPESIAGALEQPLEEDTAYHVSFALSLCDECKKATKGIGLRFMDSSYIFHYTDFDSVAADILVNEHVTEKEGWYIHQSLYMAKGGEDFLSFGLYNSPDSSTFLDNQGGVFSSSYYYIDSVVVRNATHDEINGVLDHQDRFSIYPNPASSNIRISTSGNEKPRAVVVSNPAGRIVRQERFTQELDVSELPPGVYFLRLLFDDEVGAVRRFVRM